MPPSQELVDFLKHQEGLRLKVYKDIAGYPTIGYGHRVPSMQMPPLLNEQSAATLLMADISQKTLDVIKYVPSIVGQAERRLNALIDFAFNLGAFNLKGSHLKSAVDDRDWERAAEELKHWVHAHVVHDDGSVTLEVVPALVARRAVTAGWMLEG